MLTPRRSTTIGLAIVSALALLVAACSDARDGTSATTSSTTEPSANETTTTVALPETATVPVTVTSSPEGAKVIVQASVGGGPTVAMQLDTGSAGVVVASSALGPDVEVSSTTQDVVYVGTTMSGTVAQATVAVGSLTTPSPIAVVDVVSATCGTDGDDPRSCSLSDAFGDGIQGIIGIGLSDGSDPASPDYSPLLQMASPYDEGFTLELPPSGSGEGTLVVGPVDAPSGATSVPLVASSSPTYPNGARAWAKDIRLCWSVGAAEGCGMTDLDIGSPNTLLAPSAIPGLATGTDDAVDTGTDVSVAPTQGGTPLWSFSAGTAASRDLAVSTTSLGPTTTFNTGIALFFANVVGYDNAGGQLWIWPQGSAGAASKV